MSFVLTNGNAFIGTDSRNKRITVSSQNSATAFDSNEKAAQALENLPRSFKNVGFKIKEIPDRPKQQEVAEPFDLVECDRQEEPETVLNMKAVIKNTSEFMENVQAQYSTYILELKKVEGQILDIEHKIEFTKANASQGYQLFKLLQEARLRRRECKDVLLMSDFILHASFEDWTGEKPKILLDELEERKYRPRQLPDLFAKTE